MMRTPSARPSVRTPSAGAPPAPAPPVVGRDVSGARVMASTLPGPRVGGRRVAERLCVRVVGVQGTHPAVLVDAELVREGVGQRLHVRRLHGTEAAVATAGVGGADGAA